MIGIDLVKTDRIKRFIERYGDKALQRFLHPSEMDLVKNHKTAAGFWAAKEAFSKAIGSGIGEQCSFFDIEICKTPTGAPQLKISAKVTREFGIRSSSLSITHDGDYAIAVVAVEVV